MRDLFNDYAEKLYADAVEGPAGGEEEEDGAGSGSGSGGIDDIEKEIAAEVRDIRAPASARLFTPVRVDVQCGE
jgi:hypothetical protein